jgi:hypothetical protein
MDDQRLILLKYKPHLVKVGNGKWACMGTKKRGLFQRDLHVIEYSLTPWLAYVMWKQATS